MYKRQKYNILWLASAYLWIDTLLFIPIYGIFFLALGRQIFSVLAGDAKRERYCVARFYSGILLALLLIDLVENASGIVKIHGGFAGQLLVLTAGATWVAQGWWAKKQFTLASEEIWDYSRKLGWPVLLIALVIFIGVVSIDGEGQCNGAANTILKVGCKAHHAKFSLPVIGIGLFGVLVTIAMSAALLLSLIHI